MSSNAASQRASENQVPIARRRPMEDLQRASISSRKTSLHCSGLGGSCSSGLSSCWSSFWVTWGPYYIRDVLHRRSKRNRHVLFVQCHSPVLLHWLLMWEIRSAAGNAHGEGLGGQMLQWAWQAVICYYSSGPRWPYNLRVLQVRTCNAGTSCLIVISLN